MDQKVFKETQLKLEDYEILQTILSNELCTVRLAQNKKTGEYVALKCFKKGEIVRYKKTAFVLNYKTILLNISHHFIVKMLGCAQNERFFYIFQEHVQGASFSRFLGQKKTGLGFGSVSLFYAAQVVLVLEYLHSKNIIYRSINSENILIGSDGYLKLTEFVFAKQTDKRTYTFCGFQEYLAPEIVLNTGYKKSVDWWALGILIFEMLSGTTPFLCEDPIEEYDRIKKGKFVYPKNFPEEAKCIISQFLQLSVINRLGNLKGGVNDIKMHKWFKSINWKELEQKKIQPLYIPIIKDQGDISNYFQYPESTEKVQPIKPANDPFIGW